jgi:hypothetical protein
MQKERRIGYLRLTPANVQSLREPLAQALLQRLQDDVRALLPPDTTEAIARQRLRQILACMHGMNMMLLANPRTYGLTRDPAIAEAHIAQPVPRH